MTDPRDTPGFKAKHTNDKLVLLLGAILDALKDMKPSQAPPVQVRRTKAD
jgi:hypothetical protein